MSSRCDHHPFGSDAGATCVLTGAHQAHVYHGLTVDDRHTLTEAVDW